ncbi:MAG: DUF6599 family protein [Candidatus Zixiibacteriota bacterium]
MRSLATVFLFLILVSSFSEAANNTDTGSEQRELKELLPPFEDEWKTKQVRFFTKENLFDYMDGGAEIYLAYDFQKLLVQEYLSGDKSILVEIYLMSSSEDAFGLFSLNQEGESLTLGQCGSYGFGILCFWKDHYFVRIIDMEGKDTRKDLIQNLGKSISDKIKNKGESPKLLNRIPQDNLQKQSLFYFHKNIVLNNLYFLSKENILNLSEKTNALLASYKFDNESLKLLLIEYPDTLGSRKAFVSFNQKHLKATISSLRNLQKVGEDLYSGVELKDNFLIVVLEGKTKSSVDKLLKATKNSLEKVQK